MFTGIVLEAATVLQAETSGAGSVLTIASTTVLPRLTVGDSISINGCCLTVVARDDKSFRVEATPETLRLTNLGVCRPGTRVNLEPAARLADFLGGHLVQGHVDDKGAVLEIRREGNSEVFRFSASEKVLHYCAYKGSITVNGVSLTISDLGQDYFEVTIIPHTLEVTNFSSLQIGDEVNLEADIISKYVETHVRRLMVSALLVMFFGVAPVWGEDLRLGPSTVLIFENKTPITTSQFVVRIARFGPDLVLEWENDRDQGTVHIFSKALRESKRFTLTQLYEVGVDNDSPEELTLLLSKWLLKELIEKGKIKMYLNRNPIRMELLEEIPFRFRLDGQEIDVPALRVQDSRDGVWVFVRNAEAPLVVQYENPYYSHRLKSAVRPQKNSLRWIKKLPPVR